MPSIAKLVVSLGANTASFETDMKRASRNQQKRMREMKQTAAAAAKGITVAFTAATAAMTAIVISSTKTADSMAKLGQRLGTSTEALSELGHVAKLSGVDFRTLEMGLQRMTRRIGEVAFLGKGEAKEALKILGLEAKKLADLPLDKQFEAIAEELSKVANVSQRTSLAMKVFDAEGVRLVQMMEGGATSIQAMREEAQELGVVIGGELAANSERFNDNLTRMGALAEGAGLQFTGGLLPALLKVQDYFLDSATASDTFADSGERLGEVIIRLIRTFILLKGIMQTIASALMGMVVTVVSALQAIVAPITATMKALAAASSQLAQGNFADAWKSLSGIAKQSGAEFEHALKGIKQGIDEVAGASVYWDIAQEKSLKLMSMSSKAAQKFTPTINKLADSTTEMASATDDAAKAQQDAEREAAAYESALQSLLDTLYPIEAELQRHGEQLDLLEKAYQKGDLSLTQYADAMLRTVSAMEQVQEEAVDAAQEFDLLNTAVDEGVRILERTFTNLWTNLLDGAGGAFDGIKDGFKALLASLVHQATTQKIVLNIQQGLQGTGTGPGGGINWQQFGSDLAAFAGIIAGTALGGGGESAATGAAIGSLVGSIVGTYFGPIGTMVGGLIGSILGGLVGGIFDKKPRIGAGGFNIEPGDTKHFSTALGGVFVGDTKGGMDDFVDEFGAAIKDFDKAIAAVFTDTQIGAVSESLKQWSVEKKGDFATIEEVLRNRFSAILTNFDQNINAFTRKGEDLVEQIERFTVAVSAQNLMDKIPEVFAGRDINQILAVVEAMQTGVMTIQEAWNAFGKLLMMVVAVRDSLVDFASSDLAGDFQHMLDLSSMTLAEAVTGMVSGLDDAIAAFDGSPEQLQAIGQMVFSIRDGELKLLAQIDAIQKGIQANLATLKADMLGLRDGPASDEQLFNDAQGFINAISSASSAEEIAALERQFDAVIRAMSPEAQMSNMTSILSMIDAFSSASDTALEGMKQAVLDSAASTRAMVEDFIERIGDPLDIIAGTNQEIRDALVGDGVTQGDTGQGSVEQVLEDGVEDIATEVANIGPVVADAITRALGGVDINVTVMTNRYGLTNE